jgi:nitrogen regulatory protein PII-like uncharacterized protein
MNLYRIVREDDPTDYIELEADNADEAAYNALTQLGYGVIAVEEIVDEDDLGDLVDDFDRELPSDFTFHDDMEE